MALECSSATIRIDFFALRPELRLSCAKEEGAVVASITMGLSMSWSGKKWPRSLYTSSMNGRAQADSRLFLGILGGSSRMERLVLASSSLSEWNTGGLTTAEEACLKREEEGGACVRITGVEGARLTDNLDASLSEKSGRGGGL